MADFMEFGRAHLHGRACTARNRAAATFARSSRRRTAKPCAMTRTSAYVGGVGFSRRRQPPVLYKEPLDFENVHASQRSYK